MKSENRRSFVKKSLATSLSLSGVTFMGGLVRAHGEEGGSTTGSIDTTWGSTSGPDTTFVDTTIWFDTTVPFETFVTTVPETTVPQTTTPPNFKMKCSSPAKPTNTSTSYTFGLFNNNYDSDPVGYKQIGGQWYRLFVQTVIECHKVQDDGWYSSSDITFVCKGRYSQVPCSSDSDLVPPPSDTTSATNGISGWSDWAEWTRVASITCAPLDGKMTRTAGTGDSEQPGDTGTNGSVIETDMPVGEGGTQTCKFKYKGPWGGFGDQITATAVFVSEDGH